VSQMATEQFAAWQSDSGASAPTIKMRQDTFRVAAKVARRLLAQSMGTEKLLSDKMLTEDMLGDLLGMFTGMTASLIYRIVMESTQFVITGADSVVGTTSAVEKNFFDLMPKTSMHAVVHELGPELAVIVHNWALSLKGVNSMFPAPNVAPPTITKLWYDILHDELGKAANSDIVRNWKAIMTAKAVQLRPFYENVINGMLDMFDFAQNGGMHRQASDVKSRMNTSPTGNSPPAARLADATLAVVFECRHSGGALITAWTANNAVNFQSAVAPFLVQSTWDGKAA